MSHKSKWLFLTGTFAATLYWFLSEMFNPILALYASSLGFSPVKLSIILAAQTFVPFFFTIQIGYLSDRIGQRNMLLVGASFMIGGTVLLLSFSHFIIFLVVQTLVGLGHITVWLASQSIVTFVDDQHRDKAISRMSFFAAVGQLTGPLMGGMLSDIFNFKIVFICYMVLTLCFLIVYPFCKNSVSPVSSKKANTFLETYKIGGQLYANNKGIQVATLISFSLAFILFIRVTYLPLYLEGLSYSTTQIGLFIALWSFASIIIRPFAAKLIAIFGRYKVTVFALAISIVGLIGFSVLPFTIGLMLAMLFIGLGTGLNQPLAISLVSSYTSGQNRGLGMGLRLMSNRLANWLCPLSIGAVSSFIGLSFSFALVSVPLALISFSSIKMLNKLPKKSKTPKQGVI